MCRRAIAARLAAIAALLAGASASAEVGAGAMFYGPEPQVVPSSLEARAMELAAARLRRSRRSPHVSGALVLAARELARRAAAGEEDPISRARVRGALARAPGHDPAAAAVLAVSAPEEAADAVTRSLPREGATHVGAGAVERDGKAWTVLLLADRKLKLDRFPRDVPTGTRATLSGSLLPPLSSARVFVTPPSGSVAEVGGGTGRGFRVGVEFPAPGRWVLEVLGEGEGGPEVAALLVISVGGAPLDPARGAAPRGEPEDRAQAEAAVLSTLNATRRRYGIAPLVAAPEIAAAARRHSEAMAASGRVAHVVPGSGDAGARLRARGVPYRSVFENVAAAGSALDAHAAVEESPAHLSNVLRPDATRVGIGIARARRPSGDEAVFLTEILVAPPDGGAESRLTPDARVREALWRERERLGLRPLTADPALDAIAREAARAMRSRDETDADGLGDRALALRRSLAAVDVFVASAPGEAVRSANLRDPRFGRVGVGIASGDSRRFGRGRLWIAVLYTD